MTFKVYQHWDPLRECVVGRCYPPEFFSWIQNSRLRNVFERIAIETEDDLQKIIKKLQDFGVRVSRPDVSENFCLDRQYQKPPITPRDYMVMIGDCFYEHYSTNFSKTLYNNIKDPFWPDCNNWTDFKELPSWIQEECKNIFNFGCVQESFSEYDKILDSIRNQGNTVYSGKIWVNGAMVARIGRDLFFGTDNYNQDLEKTKSIINAEFPSTRNHVINTGGHSDSTYCPVCPGLIISTYDVTSYKHTFPDWEVVYIEKSNLSANKKFSALSKKNQGKWWIPGFEYDSSLIDFIETYLTHWIGHVVETVFDVNMLIIDPKNVIVFNENKLLFDALKRYSITPHVINFRHRYFWDGGIHCLTLDLDRDGILQDFFALQDKQ